MGSRHYDHLAHGVCLYRVVRGTRGAQPKVLGVTPPAFRLLLKAIQGARTKKA